MPSPILDTADPSAQRVADAILTLERCPPHAVKVLGLALITARGVQTAVTLTAPAAPGEAAEHEIHALSLAEASLLIVAVTHEPGSSAAQHLRAVMAAVTQCRNQALALAPEQGCAA